jgi:hypothetical protein
MRDECDSVVRILPSLLVHVIDELFWEISEFRQDACYLPLKFFLNDF